MATTIRDDLVQSAVRFLQDPKVQSSPLAKKVAFLESKGLTSAEVERALALTSGSASSSSTETSAPSTALTTTAPPSSFPGPPPPAGYPGQVLTMPPPPRPRMTWKDYFILITLLGGVGYGIGWVVRTYFDPLLNWPSSEEVEKEKEALDKEFDRVASSLKKLEDTTGTLQDSLNSREKRVSQSLEEVQDHLSNLKDSDAKRSSEMVHIKEEMLKIQSSLPKLLEQQRDSQKQMISELEGEVRSLKSLLISRSNGSSAPSPAPPSSSSSSITTTTPGGEVNGSEVAQSIKSPEESSSTSRGSYHGLVQNIGKRPSGALPAWQISNKSPSPSSSSTSTTASSSSPSSSSTPSTASSSFPSESIDKKEQLD
ncbi:MAG: peroxisomal membrane anchor protein conserved region-domain-containing protein [Piptocephalis tieghemiana]|nr:MAG: peroxisomal membrane anchor protein conserved region-domain-containing protein [Piptocephalis tieghemiana]